MLEAAKEWGVPPWAIEEEAPAIWIERWRIAREETTTEATRKNKARKK